MKIYNQTKTKVVENPDLSLGHLEESTLAIHHDAVEGIEEQGHWVTLAEYPNGGKDVEWVVDVPGVEAKEAYDEEEDILVYIPFTDVELRKINAQSRIAELKKFLADTDYQAIKYAEGELSVSEYEETKQNRRAWRAEINELQKELE